MGCNDTNDNDCTYCDWNPSLFPIAVGASYAVGDMTFDNNCNLYISSDDGIVFRINHNTTNVQQIATFFNNVRGIEFNPNDGLIYVAEFADIKKMTTTGTNVQTVITGLNAYLNGMTIAPAGWGSYGGHLVASSSSGQIYVVNPASPAPTVLANLGSEVSYVEFDKQNKVLYAAAYTQGLIMTVSSSGAVSPYVAAGCSPDGVAVDDGNRLFFTCSCNNQVFRVNIPTPGTPVLVGSPTLNCSWAPSPIIYDGLNDLLVLHQPSATELTVFTP
jgi:hypothetical protein